MKSLNKILIAVVAIIIVVVAALALLSNFKGSSSDSGNNFAGMTGLAGLNVTKDGLKVGTTTPTFRRFNGGICYIAPYAATIAATSTATVDCQGTQAWNAAGTRGTSAIAGVKNGEAVVGTLSTTTAGTTVGGLHLIGISASSTPGFFSARVANFTGTTYTWPTTSGIASGTINYWSPSLNQ